MKRSVLLLLAVLLSFGFYSKAQEKVFTLEDMLPGGQTFYNFTPKSIYGLQWLGDHYIYFENGSIMKGNPEGKKAADVWITLDGLNELLEKEGLEKLERFPGFSVSPKNPLSLEFRIGNELVQLAPDGKSIVGKRVSKRKMERADYCPENGLTAFVKDNSLFVADEKGEETLIAKSEEEGICYGTDVHQREFGIYKGTFWSPKGRFLAFYRMDERDVKPYPIPDLNPVPMQVKMIHYPMAGRKSHHVTLGIYDCNTKNIVYVETGQPEETFLTNIAWNPNEQSVYIAEINRAQNHMDLKAYDPTTGKLQLKLFSEDDEHYVEPQTPIMFLPNNDHQFIYESRRDGYNHLYLYSTDGKLIKQLTSGAFEVTRNLGMDAAGRNLYFISTEQSPITRQLYSVDIKNNKKRQLTTVEGMHSFSLSSSKKFFIDSYSSHKIPRNIEITNTRSLKSQTLLDAADPYDGYKVPEIECGTLKADDGATDLYYRLVKPINMEKGKKYPVVIYVYGGPHSQLITDRWNYGAGGWDIYMAQRGYVVFTLDNRGTSARGKAFEQAIHRNLGKYEMQDQMTGVRYLLSLPYVDKDRVGVHGWSFGGFMTTNLILSYPEVFKVAVAGGPVMDWSMYEIMYGERYMDMPQENKEGYDAANLLKRAKDLKGKLLLIHGTADPVVVWQHSLLFLKACINGHTYPDYFVYPQHEHNMIGRDRVHLYEKISQYFKENL